MRTICMKYFDLVPGVKEIPFEDNLIYSPANPFFDRANPVHIL